MGADRLLPYTLLALSPPQWALVILLAVLLFAPGLMRPLGRLAGRLLAAELRRRAGLPPLRGEGARRRGGERATPSPNDPTTQRPDVEVLPPEHPRPTLRASDPTPLAPPTPGKPLAPIWVIAAVFVGAVAVLLWFLLRSQ
jgi:hypothetical protein